MAKKIITIIGAIVAAIGVAVGVILIVRRILSKNCRCHEEVEFDNYVECPCCGDDCECDEIGTPGEEKASSDGENAENTAE